jgi:hypothetical protein
MKPPVFDESTNNTILNQVQQGMHVCDSNGDDIGTVRQVFLGAVSDKTHERGGGPATAPDPGGRHDDSLIDNLAEAFSPDDPLPEALRGRLLRQGFIRIDTAGLFASDRYAMPDQIESVSDDCVRLRLTKDELIEH